MIFKNLFLSHLLGDFIFQTDKMVANKKNGLINKTRIYHSLVHMVLSLFMIILISKMEIHGDIIIINEREIIIPILLPAIVIGITHYFIDYFKSKIKLKEIYTFLIDQGLHILVMVLVSFYLKNLSKDYMKDYVNLFSNDSISISNYFYEINIIISLLIVMIMATKVSGIIIELILENLRDREEPKKIVGTTAGFMPENLQENIEVEEKNINRGKYIGYFERMIVVVLVINNSYTAIGLLGTFKTMARFKQLEDESFAEYYILGTLISIFFGIVIGFIGIRI